MYFESKVQTTADITCTLEQMRLDDANIFLDKKWVSLEECQKMLRDQKLVSDSDLDSWKKYLDYQLKQKDGIIDRLNETIESEETENISVSNKLTQAKKLSENIYHKCLDEWCRTDDCPDCEDCSFLAEIKRLYEVLK